jgi:hypothetical protein
MEEHKLALDESKETSEWYVKWSNAKQLNTASSKTKWSFQVDEKGDQAQMRQFNQLAYPTAVELDSTRYMSSVGYDFSRGIWNRIVSVPFLASNVDIRGVVAITVSLNKLDLKQCGSDDSNHLANDQHHNSFLYNTDKCERESTEVNRSMIDSLLQL